MSVSSILAFVLAGAAAKAKSVQVARRSDDRIAELIALRIDNADLRRELDQARADYDALRRATDFGHSHGLQAPQPAGPDFRPPHIALQQQAAALQMQAQANMQAQQAQLAQYQGLQNAYQNQGLAQNLAGMGWLGAQNLIDAELFCNCVPSRSQVWATSDPE